MRQLYPTDIPVFIHSVLQKSRDAVFPYPCFSKSILFRLRTVLPFAEASLSIRRAVMSAGSALTVLDPVRFLLSHFAGSNLFLQFRLSGFPAFLHRLLSLLNGGDLFIRFLLG